MSQKKADTPVFAASGTTFREAIRAYSIDRAKRDPEYRRAWQEAARARQEAKRALQEAHPVRRGHNKGRSNKAAA